MFIHIEIGQYITWRNKNKNRLIMEIEKINGSVITGVAVNCETVSKKEMSIDTGKYQGKLINEYDTTAIKFFKFITGRTLEDEEPFRPGDKIPE